MISLYFYIQRILFEKYVEVAPTHKKAMHNALSAVITKDVQILFTAFGRQKNETKKLNFSKTKIYNLLMGMFYLCCSLIKLILKLKI